MEKALVVYTVVMGGNYDLPPTRPQDCVDYICFTDQQGLNPNGWTIRYVSPLISSDSFRSSREYKILPHRWLAEYPNSIYIDSTVHLHKDATVLWDQLIPNEATVFGGFYHSYRATVADEFRAVTEAKLDHPYRIREQLEAYLAHHAETLSDKPVWGGVLARRHNTEACIKVMEAWFIQILRYSRRDQLSLPLALSGLSREQLNLASADIYESDYHKWPISKKAEPVGLPIIDDGEKTRNEAWKILQPASSMQKRIRKFHRSLEKRKMLPSQWFAESNSEKSKGSPPKGGAGVSFGHDHARKLFYAQDAASGKKVYVSDRKRLELYRGGIGHRQSWILGDYRLPGDLVRKGDVVVDVGANIGELGLWVEARGGHYIAFEPDPSAFLAMQNNITAGDLYDVALSNTNGSAQFYLNTAEADSSLFKPDDISGMTTVRTATLDSFFAEVGKPPGIRLLKVEAEGMEPEVLAGAIETLRDVEYVAVDAGPERGGNNTVSEVLNLLSSAGFEVLDCFLLRGTFLLRKKDAI